MGDDIILLTFVNVLVTKTEYLFGATYIKKKKQENNQCLMRCYLSLCKHLADTCTNVYIYFKNASTDIDILFRWK